MIPEVTDCSCEDGAQHFSKNAPGDRKGLDQVKLWHAQYLVRRHLDDIKKVRSRVHSRVRPRI